jgi:hypothetical protein
MPVLNATFHGMLFLPDVGYPLPTPQPPLGIWGGSSPGVMPQPLPGQGLPGNQPYPDQGLPGNQPYPDQGLPGNQPYPSLPIYIPPSSGNGGPSQPVNTPPTDSPYWMQVYLPRVGWVWAIVPKPQSGGGGEGGTGGEESTSPSR